MIVVGKLNTVVRWLQRGLVVCVLRELCNDLVVRNVLMGLRRFSCPKDQADRGRHEPCHLTHWMNLLMGMSEPLPERQAATVELGHITVQCRPTCYDLAEEDERETGRTLKWHERDIVLA